MEVSNTFPEAEASREAFPVGLNLYGTSEVLAKSGIENIDKGGQKLLRLANSDSEIRIHPGMMSARITAAEHMHITHKLFNALYELGDLTGSGMLPRTPLPKPFNLSMTIPRFLEEYTQSVIPATAENIVNTFSELFTEDEETQRIIRGLTLSFSEETKTPAIELVLETPGIKLSDHPNVPLTVNSFGKRCRYTLDMRELDLATALQIAIQKVVHTHEPSSPTMLLTDRTTKDGKRIAVSSIQSHRIVLREVSNENQAAAALHEITPTPLKAVSSMAVFRKLV
ncbi:MAG: hypothetical protein Q8P62_03335 [Candidatus Peregrinibacteria bacterium]|nr:hypothetical protein [Candidatus Peregrinibacteria bacterium]